MCPSQNRLQPTELSAYRIDEITAGSQVRRTGQVPITPTLGSLSGSGRSGTMIRDSRVMVMDRVGVVMMDRVGVVMMDRFGVMVMAGLGC